MVDFQSRDTRRGPTDGDDEAGDERGDTADEETGDDAPVDDEPEESADSAATDGEAVSAADSHSGDEGSDPDTAAGEDGTDASDAAATTEAGGGESSPADVIDEAAARTADSQSATGEADERADGTRPQSGAANHATAESDAAGQPAAESDTAGQPTAESDAANQPAAESDTPASASETDPLQSDQSAGAPADEPATTAAREQTAPDADAGTQQVAAAVVTVGTATEAGDPTGEALDAALRAAGQTVVAHERLRGDYDGIQRAVDRLTGREDVDVVVTAGDIGVGPSEHTLEAVHPLFEKALPGFEEVYRSLLFERQGTGVISVRATAGIADGTPVFCLPAAPDAARVAIDEIISAEAGALVEELQ